MRGATAVDVATTDAVVWAELALLLPALCEKVLVLEALLGAPPLDVGEV